MASNLTRLYSPLQYGGSAMASSFNTSRTQERAELQQLNDRLAAYVQHVRLMAEKRGQVDSSALLKSAKAMETEITTIRTMYEQELDKLRKDLEACNHEKATHHVQCNKHMQCASELQDRLNAELERSTKLQEESSSYQARMTNLEVELQNLRLASTRPNADLENLQRTVSNLTRELEAWKHRYEHETVARQEAEGKIQQLMQKFEFNDKVNRERVGEMNARMEMSASTILSLEAKIRDLNKADINITDVLKQVRETAEAELKKYQIESEEQYNKSLTALKAQIDSDAKVKETLEAEKIQLRGTIGELQAKIGNLEGQMASLEHQKRTLEEAMGEERSRAMQSVRQLEQQVRAVQDQLVAKMRELTTAREQSLPLKAEIEALKALLEEEEKRLQMTATGLQGEVGTSSVSNFTRVNNTMYNTASNTNTTTAVATNTSGCFNVVSSNTGVAASNMAMASNLYQGNAGSSSPLPTYPPYTAGGYGVGLGGDDLSRPYAPSPPVSVTYIPEALQPTGTSIDPMFTFPKYDGELDPQLFGYTGSLPLSKYTCENSPGLNRVAVEPSPPITPRSGGGPRAKSAPEERLLPPTDKKAERQRSLNLIRSDVGQGHDYFDKMFHDLQQDTLYSQGRPRSSQNVERPMSSVFHDYAVSTSSAVGDLKIAEVHNEGRYIRLVNDGDQELEFGGYMIQQNVGGHPVAVFRFPPRTKFPRNSTVTVHCASSDTRLHQPPQCFVWKEQTKWGSGPECTTILCKPNGQAVAWTTAAHRFSRDTYHEDREGDRSHNRVLTTTEEKTGEEVADDDSVAEGSTGASTNGNRQPVGLRREKQQPPSLQAGGVNGQCPDVVPGLSGSGSQRKYVSGVSAYQHTTMRNNGKSVEVEGEGLWEEPNPFMPPRARFQTGLDLVHCQQASHFLPPMPHPPPPSSAW